MTEPQRDRIRVDALVDELATQLPDETKDMAETLVIEELEALTEADLVEFFGIEDVLILTLAPRHVDTLRDWLRRFREEDGSS